MSYLPVSTVSHSFFYLSVCLIRLQRPPPPHHVITCLCRICQSPLLFNHFFIYLFVFLPLLKSTTLTNFNFLFLFYIRSSTAKICNLTNSVCICVLGLPLSLFQCCRYMFMPICVSVFSFIPCLSCLYVPLMGS
jgi:hypothetical protein